MIDRNYIANLAQSDTDINVYLMSLYNIPVQINAQTIVELGAGQSTFALTAAANMTKGQFYSFDMGPAPQTWCRGFPTGIGILENEERFHFTQISDIDAEKSWSKPIDFLFLDTSHTYQHTRQELEVWPRHVRQGGIFVMHDTAHEAGDGMGCRKALNEWIDSSKYTIVHLLDPKIIGLSIMVKLANYLE